MKTVMMIIIIIIIIIITTTMITLIIYYNSSNGIQVKVNDKRVRRFGDILAPLSREPKLCDLNSN